MTERKTKDSLAVYYRVLWRHKKQSLILLVFILVYSASESLSLGLLMPLLETVTRSSAGTSSNTLQYFEPILKHFHPDQAFLVIGLGLIVLVLLKSLFFVLKTWASFQFAFKFRQEWMEAIFQKYLCAQFPWLIKQKQGVMLNNLITEPVQAAKALQQMLELLSKVILSIFLYGILMFINWKLTVGITAFSVLIAFFLNDAVFHFSMRVGKKRLAVFQELNAVAAESITAVRQIKLFSMENTVFQEFSVGLRGLLKILIKFRVINALPNTVTESVLMVGIISVLLYLQYVLKVELVSLIPAIAVFVLVSQKLFPLLASLYSEKMNVLSFQPSLKLVDELTRGQLEQEKLDGGEVIASLQNDIKVEDLSFDYTPQKPLFRHLNLTIPRGKVTAIVGSSGSGKSTLVDLLVGLLPYQEGRILINEIDIKRIHLGSWRKMVGYVSQETFLFNDTVRNNILVGKPNASESEIIAAARAAYAHDFIIKMPQGYDTVLGDRGLKISGGERQRLAIARVVIRNPELYIFDEATSALDVESERLVQKAISDLAKTKTIIIISHRLQSVEKADQIVVIKDGMVSETGSYQQLMACQGDYYQMSNARTPP